MSKELNIREELDFYRRELLENILPFWIERALDRDYGGDFTCFNNGGTELVSTDKYVWSQGRLVWVFAELAAMLGEERFLDYAKLGVDFLLQHALLEDGSAAFLLSRTGEPKEPTPGSGFATSIYADCFVVLGLSRYAQVTNSRDILQFAKELYQSIERRLQGEFRTDPYPIPPGMCAHGVAMILLTTSQELRDAQRALGDVTCVQTNEKCRGYVQLIFDYFCKDGLLQEMVHLDQPGESLLERYINPGHSLECLWFMLHQALEDGDQALVEACADLIENTYKVGWDEHYGGLLLFVDREGGPPRGEVGDLAGHPMVHKVQQDWSHKLWWPHSEALYTTLLAYHLTKRSAFLELYAQTKDYTFRTFPHPDPAVGEWIQIRDRQGAPLEAVVALPVKDPFHIARCLMLILQLLEKMEQPSGGGAK